MVHAIRAMAVLVTTAGAMLLGSVGAVSSQTPRPTLPPRPGATAGQPVEPAIVPQQPASTVRAGPSTWDTTHLYLSDRPALRGEILDPDDAAANLAAWYSDRGRTAACPVVHIRVHAVQTLPALGQVDVHYTMRLAEGVGPGCEAWTTPQRLEVISVPADNVLGDSEWFVPAWQLRLVKP